jgi:hypothetical protein
MPHLTLLGYAVLANFGWLAGHFEFQIRLENGIISIIPK